MFTHGRLQPLMSLIVLFLFAGSLCFFLLLFEIAVGPLFIVSDAWKLIGLISGAVFLVSSYFFVRSFPLGLITINGYKKGTEAAAALYIFLVLISFVMAPAIGYTTLFGSPYQSAIYIPDMSKSDLINRHGRGGLYYVAGNNEIGTMPSYKIASPHLSNGFWQSLCVPTKYFSSKFPMTGFIKVSGKKSFFGKTISQAEVPKDMRTHSELMKQLPELNDFWEAKE